MNTLRKYILQGDSNIQGYKTNMQCQIEQCKHNKEIVSKVLKSQLKGANTTLAINLRAFLMITYNAGVIKLKKDELQILDRMIRKYRIQKKEAKETYRKSKQGARRKCK